MKKSDINGRLKESLSAAMDGEANEMELHRVLANLQEQEMRQTANNYQLIGDVLRKQNTPAFTIDLSDKIRKSIDAEPSPEAKKTTSRKLTQGLGKLAVAASVTLAVIVGVRTWNTGPAEQKSVVANVQRTPDSNGLLLGQSPDRTQNYGARGLLAGSRAKQTALTPEQLQTAKHIANAQTIERFKAYSLNHAEQLATQNMQGMLPFVRAVSFQSH